MSQCKCSTCGDPLKFSVDVSNSDLEIYVDIEVEPCSTCMSKADDEGFDRGHGEGFSEGEASVTEEIGEIAVRMYKEVEDANA